MLIKKNMFWGVPVSLAIKNAVYYNTEKRVPWKRKLVKNTSIHLVWLRKMSTHYVVRLRFGQPKARKQDRVCLSSGVSGVVKN